LTRPGDLDAPGWRKVVASVADLVDGLGTSPAPVGPTFEPDAKPQTERRRLTVLSCNLIRRPTAPLDAEDWHAVVGRHRRGVAAAVARFEGYVTRGLGDDLLVYFGYPEAREDAAERAVRAGLAILEVLPTLKVGLAGTLNLDLTVRIGVHAGVVVISSVGQEVEMFGEAPELAARVQALAEPDSVLMTGEVEELVAGLFLIEERPQASESSAELARLYRAFAPIVATRRGRGYAAREPTRFVAGRTKRTCFPAAGSGCVRARASSCCWWASPASARPAWWRSSASVSGPTRTFGSRPPARRCSPTRPSMP
jgi:class 3 adenylate cyclase